MSDIIQWKKSKQQDSGNNDVLADFDIHNVVFKSHRETKNVKIAFTLDNGKSKSNDLWSAYGGQLNYQNSSTSSIDVSIFLGHTIYFKTKFKDSYVPSDTDKMLINYYMSYAPTYTEKFNIKDIIDQNNVCIVKYKYKQYQIEGTDSVLENNSIRDLERFDCVGCEVNPSNVEYQQISIDDDNFNDVDYLRQTIVLDTTISDGEYVYYDGSNWVKSDKSVLPDNDQTKLNSLNDIQFNYMFSYCSQALEFDTIDNITKQYPIKQNIYGIGESNQYGFGVGVCDIDSTTLQSIGISPLDGYNDPLNDNYGNYKDSDGNVLVWIPAFKCRFGNLEQQSSYDYNSVEIWNIDDNNAPSDTVIPRGFYNNGTLHSGVFIDKYLNVLENNKFISKPTDGSYLSWAQDSDANIISNIKSPYHALSIFELAIIRILMCYHYQHSNNDKTNAWYYSTGWPFPCHDSTPEIYNSLLNTHNGQACGIHTIFLPNSLGTVLSGYYNNRILNKTADITNNINSSNSYAYDTSTEIYETYTTGSSYIDNKKILNGNKQYFSNSTDGQLYDLNGVFGRYYINYSKLLNDRMNFDSLIGCPEYKRSSRYLTFGNIEFAGTQYTDLPINLFSFNDSSSTVNSYTIRKARYID